MTKKLQVMPSSDLGGRVQGGGSIVGPRGKAGERCEFNPLVGFTLLLLLLLLLDDDDDNDCDDCDCVGIVGASGR